MKELLSKRRSNKERRPKRRLAALGVAAISAFVPGGTPHELTKVDSNFICDVARHRAQDPQLKDERKLQDLIVNAYGLKSRDGYQLGYYFDLATSPLGQPVPITLENEIVNVKVQDDPIGPKFIVQHHQLERDATRPDADSITIISDLDSEERTNPPVALYSKRMIVGSETRDRFYPLESGKQKIIDPATSPDTELTKRHGVEIVRFCEIPGKGEIPVTGGYLHVGVFPVVYVQRG